MGARPPIVVPTRTKIHMTRLSTRVSSAAGRPPLESQAKVEQRSPAADGRTQLDPRVYRAPHRPPVGELRHAAAAREQLASPWTQAREPSAVAAEIQPQAVLPEPLGDIAAVDQEEPEQARFPESPDG